MRKELIALREKMESYGFDAYMIPTSDFHQSEYVHAHFKCREFVSGFTGSAGTLIVTMEDACLWTDGRYFLQAAAQLEGSGIRLMKMGVEGVPTIVEYLEDVLDDDDKPTGAKKVEFTVDSYMEAFYYMEAGKALADQGFTVTAVLAS